MKNVSYRPSFAEVVIRDLLIHYNSKKKLNPPNVAYVVIKACGHQRVKY